MDYAQRMLKTNCTPWFFPTQDDPVRICNPWEAIDFKDIMFRWIPDDECNHCLPDCSETEYNTEVSVSPFRRCDYKNLGVSKLCNFDDPTLPEPRIWGYTVLDEYEHRDGIPRYIENQVVNSKRKHLPLEELDSSVFNFMNLDEDISYHAYQVDMAVAHFYFGSSTALQYLRQPRLSWTDFIGQIGGLLGLCIGFSLVSVVELVYWFLFKLIVTMTAVDAKERRRSLGKVLN